MIRRVGPGGFPTTTKIAPGANPAEPSPGLPDIYSDFLQTTVPPSTAPTTLPQKRVVHILIFARYAMEDGKQIMQDLAFLDAVAVPCEVCQGRRFKDEVLAYRLHGKSIADVLDMTIRQALEFFQRPSLSAKLQALSDVGLDYLTLGQPLSTLSGGECQRIKLASELHQAGSVYVLDEPTTGLHMSDIARLLEVLNRLVDAGNTVIVIEHNHDVICSADWIIDLGPEGGNKGGKVVFEGTPQQLLRAKKSLTGKYLRG